MKIKPSIEEVEKFSKVIDDLVWEHDISILDAILLHCENTELDMNVASVLLSSGLKEQLLEEVEKLNLVKKTNKLPV